MTTASGSKLFLVDSTGYIEYFGKSPKADAFGKYLEQESLILLPTIVIYEVYKKLARDAGAMFADRFLAYSHRLGERVVGLDAGLALLAARTSMQHGLSMADAIIYSAAQVFQADLISSDQHFQGLPGVTLL